MPTTEHHTASVAFRDVARHFGRTVALESFDLDVAPGEFVTLLGPSGSGKTTALNILAGFLDADRGDVLIAGRSVLALPSEARNVGMVFQSFALFPHMSVFDNVAFPLRMRRISRSVIREKVGAALETVRLGDYAGRRPAALSGGQRQRVALARAIVFEPPVLLMDECLSALDLKLREELQGVIRRLHREIGSTVLFVTHDQGEALTMSDRVAVMRDGRIIQIDTPENLYDRPGSRFVAEFIGQTNVLDATSANGRLAVPELGVELDTRGGAGGDTTAISLRPERIRRAGQIPGAAAQKTFDAVLEDETFFGPVVARTVRLAGGRLLEFREQRTGAEAATLPGDTISLAFLPEDAIELSADRT